jgi:hypothetical protein
VLSPLQTLSGEKPSPALHLNIVLLLVLALASRPRWLVLFLLMCDEGELQSHQLIFGVGLAHLLTLVILMAGAQWTLCNLIEGLVVPLRVQPQFCRTSPPAWFLVSIIFPARRHSQLR